MLLIQIDFDCSKEDNECYYAAIHSTVVAAVELCSCQSSVVTRESDTPLSDAYATPKSSLTNWVPKHALTDALARLTGARKALRECCGVLAWYAGDDPPARAREALIRAEGALLDLGPETSAEPERAWEHPAYAESIGAILRADDRHSEADALAQRDD